MAASDRAKHTANAKMQMQKCKTFSSYTTAQPSSKSLSVYLDCMNEYSTPGIHRQIPAGIHPGRNGTSAGGSHGVRTCLEDVPALFIRAHRKIKDILFDHASRERILEKILADPVRVEVFGRPEVRLDAGKQLVPRLLENG